MILEPVFSVRIIGGTLETFLSNTYECKSKSLQYSREH